MPPSHDIPMPPDVPDPRPSAEPDPEPPDVPVPRPQTACAAAAGGAHGVGAVTAGAEHPLPEHQRPKQSDQLPEEGPPAQVPDDVEEAGEGAARESVLRRLAEESRRTPRVG